jgi:hypothetical protein
MDAGLGTHRSTVDLEAHRADADLGELEVDDATAR